MRNAEKMVMVPRELLERYVSSVEEHGYGFDGDAEIREFLDKPAEQHQGRPTGLSQGWNLTRQHDGFVIGHSSREPLDKHKQQALKDGYVYVPFMVEQHQGEPVAFHMGDAMVLFKLLATDQISRRVDGAEHGVLGATEVTLWRSKIGLTIEKHSSNGGETIYIHPNADPGEVERLRAHMAKVENMLKIREEQNEEFGKLIEEQHAKLAEAHALLRGLAKDQDGSVLEEWRAALADSAEPSAPVEIDERAEFERENRYIVLKRNRLSFLPMELQARLKCALDDAQAILTNLDCVVVEKDWPEYEAAWESIAARVALAHKP